MNPSWQVFTDRRSLLKAAVEIIHQCEDRSGDTFSIVLAGGQTPLELYRMLVREHMQWHKWRVYFGDERCFPTGHPDRNTFQAMQALLAHVPISENQIFIPPAELGPIEAALRYSAVLSQAGEFDLVLLGLGEDGHTASLFPGRDIGAGQDAPAVLPVFDAPKPPLERISLSVQRLSRAKQVVFLVTGSGKREAITRWKKGEDLPASLISAVHGVTVLADEDACPHELEEKGDCR